MMQVNFLIENDACCDNTDELVKSVEKRDHAAKTIKYIPFFGREDYYDYFPPDSCTVFFGSTNMAADIQRKTNWCPGVFGNFENLKCSSYYPYFAENMWNLLPIFLPYGVLKKNIDYYAALLSDNDPDWSLFIRPNSGHKIFTGQIINKDNYKKEFVYLDSRCKQEEIILIDVAYGPELEYRLFCSDNKVITGSRYYHEGKLAVSNQIPNIVLEDAEKFLSQSDWFPDQLFVMDVGVHKVSKQTDIVEFNSWSCAGFYASDIDAIVTATAEAAIEEYKEHYS